MSRQENLAAQLAFLVENGSMPRTRCNQSLLRALAPLLSAGVIEEARGGAGRRLIVRNPAALRAFATQEVPLAGTSAQLGSRVRGVACFRDSKAAASDTPLLVAVRAWSEVALTRRSKPTGAAAATAEHGAFCFFLRELDAYVLDTACALVENPAVFTQFERLCLPVNFVIYAQGRVSGRLLQWLAAQRAPEFSLLHLPDYDPVGLAEFVRLREVLGVRVRLHLPLDLNECFARFSNRALVQATKSRAVLAALRNSALPEVQEVLALIHAYHAGLEQEALLI
jgi:hypothetical protein